MTTSTLNDSKLNNSKNSENAGDCIAKSAMDIGKEQASHLLEDAKNYADKGKEAAKEKIKEVEEAVKNQSDVFLDYVRTQPVKSVLIALGAGYALSLMTRK